MKVLEKGDRCPICGGIIRTEDEARLFILSFFAEHEDLRKALLGGKEEEACSTESCSWAGWSGTLS